MKSIIRFFATGKDKPPIQDEDKVNRLYKKYRLSVMLAISVGYGLAYTLRLALNMVKKPILDAGIFTPTDLGNIGSALLYTYAIGKFTNGFLADHANVKRFFSFGVLMSALVNIAMGSSAILWLWIVLWGLNGWFQSFGAPTGAVTLSNWFSKSERGRFYGIWSTGHNIGEGLTFVVTSAVVSYWGWRAGFIVPGLFCILLSGLIYLTLQDKPRTLGLPLVADWKKDHDVVPILEKNKAEKTVGAQLKVLKTPAIWVLGFASAFVYMTRYAINSWGVLYLQEAKGYSLLETGGILGLNTVAGIFGCIVYGFISDKLFKARRPPVTLIYGIIELTALFIIFFSAPNQPILVTAAFICYGFTMSGLLASLGGLFAIDIAPKKAAGAAMGFIGIFSYIGAGIQDQISGLLIEKGCRLVDGALTYDFSKVIMYWIGSSALSMILAATLWKAKTSD